MNEIQILKKGSELEEFLEEFDVEVEIREKKLIKMYGFKPKYHNHYNKK